MTWPKSVVIIYVGDTMESDLRTFYDVQQLLKKFGTIIYTRDRELDLFLMEVELRQLHESGMIDTKLFQQGLLIFKAERRKLEEKSSLFKGDGHE